MKLTVVLPQGEVILSEMIFLEDLKRKLVASMEQPVMSAKKNAKKINREKRKKKKQARAKLGRAGSIEK